MTNREILKTPKQLLREVDRQRQFLLRVESTPVPCPACKRSVNAFEAAGIDLDEYDFGNIHYEYRCPGCGADRPVLAVFGRGRKDGQFKCPGVVPFKLPEHRGTRFACSDCTPIEAESDGARLLVVYSLQLGEDACNTVFLGRFLYDHLPHGVIATSEVDPDLNPIFLTLPCAGQLLARQWSRFPLLLFSPFLRDLKQDECLAGLLGCKERGIGAVLTPVG